MTVAEAVRDAITAVYTGADAIGRALVVPGLAAWDCPGLYVQVERTYGHDGNIAGEQLQPLSRHAAHTMRAATVSALMLRCVPVADEKAGKVVLPSIAAEEAAAEVIYGDAQRMVNALVAAERAGDLGGCHGLIVEGWTSVGPDGGIGGGLLRVRVNLTGL